VRTALSSLVLLAACGAAPAPSVVPTSPGVIEEGLASWYGERHHGRPTASGEPFDMNAFTAAHRTLPMNTRVRVTNRKNGRSVEVRINDRGPYARGRIIDVSKAAARALDMVSDGVVPVSVEVMFLPPKPSARRR
jgi:rare lipoprotein A